MSSSFDTGGPDDPTIHLPRASAPDHPRSYQAAFRNVRARLPGSVQRMSSTLGVRTLIIAGVAAVVVLGAVVVLATVPGAAQRKVVEATVFQGNLVQTIPSSGQLSSGIFNLGFFAAGRIADIDVVVGQNVSAGTVLARLDVTPLNDALNTAEAQLAVAQVAYNNALLGLKSAQDNQAAIDAAAQDTYNSIATPVAGQATPTPEQLQQAQDNLNKTETAAQNQVNAAQSQVNLTQSQVTVAQTLVYTSEHNLANSTLRAPVSGQIASINGNVGETVGQTGTASMPLIVLSNLTTLQATGLVDETNIGNVQMGWPVTFTVRAFPNLTFAGTVAGVSPIPHPEASGVGYNVTIAIAAQSAAQARLFPAMTVSHITITTQEAVGALLIPTAALAFAQSAIQRTLLPANSGQIALQQAQQIIVNATSSTLKQGHAAFVAQWLHGKLVAVPVVIGLSDANNTVVLSGLNLGDAVVLSDA